MATKNIKGITIEIDGQTQPLSNALKDLNKDLKAVDKEIKNVDQALKLDSGNAEQVARKLELLEEKAELAQKKVERLKEAQKQMDAQGVDKASKEYQNLVTEIAKAEGAYKDIQVQIERTGASFNEVSEGSKQLQAFLKATGQSADDLTSILGSKLVDAIKTGQLGAAGYQTVLNKLSQELTGTAKNADLLKNALSGSSLDETKQALNQLSTSAQDYRTKITDLEQAQTRLNTYFQATGTSVKDFANVLGSELVSKIQNGKASSQELAIALDKIGASALENSGDIDKFKATLDSVDSGVSFSSIKGELDSLGSKAKDTEDDVKSLGEKLEQLNDSAEMGNLMDAGDALEPLSNALNSVGGAALEASGTIQDATSQIKVGLGQTSEEAEKSLEIVRSVLRDGYGDSVDGVTEKFVYMKQVLGDAVEPSQLQPLLEQFITLEDGGMDFNETVRASQQLMRTFGLDSSQAMDLLTAGMQDGLNYTDELSDNLAEYSGRWKESGVSASEYFSLLKAGTENGAYNLDKVGDYLNEFLTSLSDGRLEENMGSFSQSTQEVFSAYKDNKATVHDVLNAVIGDMQNMTSETDRAALASTIWSSLGEDNCMDMILALGNVEDKYGDISGTAQQAAEDNSNSVTTMTAAWNDLKLALAPVGEKLAELATTILTALRPIIEWLSNAFNSLPGPIQTFIVAFGAITAVIVPLITIIGGVVAAFGAIATAIGAPILGPLALIVAAISAVIAIFTNWGSICDWLMQVWNGFTGWLSEAFGGIGESIGGLWNAFCTELSTEWQNLWTLIQEGWETTTAWFSNIFTTISEVCGEGWSAFATFISDTWNNCWNTVSNFFTQISANIQITWNNFIKILIDLWNACHQKISEITQNLQNTLTSIWNNIVSNIQIAWNNFVKVLIDLWNVCKQRLSDITQNLHDTLTNIWNNISSFLSDTWNNLKSNASSIWDNIKSTITDKAQNIKDGLSGKWNEIVNDFSNIWNGIKDKASQIWENVKNVVANGVNALKNLMNFNWQLPKIKLPHFRISGSFSLNPPRVPSFGIDWYKKGGILTAPTIFGMNGNSLLGGGESGKEAVAPIDTLTGYIEEAVDTSNKELANKVDQLINIMSSFCNEALNKEYSINIDGRSVARTIAAPMDNQLGIRQKMKARQ